MNWNKINTNEELENEQFLLLLLIQSVYPSFASLVQQNQCYLLVEKFRYIVYCTAIQDLKWNSWKAIMFYKNGQGMAEQNIQKKVEIHTVCNAASLGLLRGIPWSTAFFFGPMME